MLSPKRRGAAGSHHAPVTPFTAWSTAKYASADPPNSFDSATPTIFVIWLKMVAKTLFCKSSLIWVDRCTSAVWAMRDGTHKSTACGSASRKLGHVKRRLYENMGRQFQARGATLLIAEEAIRIGDQTRREGIDSNALGAQAPSCFSHKAHVAEL
eukprot:scaffold90964_cov30-Tisochrysis_lutea.AAC.3